MEATEVWHTMRRAARGRQREQGNNLSEVGASDPDAAASEGGGNPPSIDDRARGGRPRRRTGASEN